MIAEREYLSDIHPVSAGLGYGQSSLCGQVNVLTNTEISLYVPGEPTDVKVADETSGDYRYNAGKLAFSMKRGSYSLTVRW